MPTETRCTSAVAAVIPINTGPGRKRVAKVSAMSCDLSPSSATKMTTKLSAAAARKSDKEHLPVRAGRKGAGATSTRPCQHSQAEGLVRPGRTNPGPPGRTLTAPVCRPGRAGLLPFARFSISGARGRLARVGGVSHELPVTRFGLVLHPTTPVADSIATIVAWAAGRGDVALAREQDRDRVPAGVELVSDDEFAA